MFATVGSSSNGDNNGTFSSEQRRPFWATRPADEEDTTSKTVAATVVHTIDHKVNATGAAAGLSMDDILGKKETKKEKAARKKKKAEVKEDDEEEMVDDDEEEEASAESDSNSVTNSYIVDKIAAGQKITKALSKHIVDQVFEILSEVCDQRMALLYFNEAFLISDSIPTNMYVYTLIPFSFCCHKKSIVHKKKISIYKFGIFSTSIQKPKTMTNIKTKEKYEVPAKYRLVFKQSTVLRKKISELEVSPEDMATK